MDGDEAGPVSQNTCTIKSLLKINHSLHSDAESGSQGNSSLFVCVIEGEICCSHNSF